MNSNKVNLQETEVIELRQQDKIKSTSSSASEYRCTLEKAVTLSEGDIVKIKSCFIDSQAVGLDKVKVIAGSSDFEQTHNVLKLTIKHGMYYRDWGYSAYDINTQRDYMTTLNFNGDNAIPRENDGMDYVLCLQTGAEVGVDIYDYEEISFMYIPKDVQKKNDPVHIKMSYKDQTGADHSFILFINHDTIINNLNKATDGQTIFRINQRMVMNTKEGGQKNPLPFRAIGGSLTMSPHTDTHLPSPTNQAKDGGLVRNVPKYDDLWNIVNHAQNFTPAVLEQDFYLPAGLYLKPELARTMNHLFNKLGNWSSAQGGQQANNMTPFLYDNFSNPLADPDTYEPDDIEGNTFMMTDEALRQLMGNGTAKGAAADDAGKPKFVRTDGNNAFNFKKHGGTGTIKNYWVGSSLGIALDFDEKVNKFEVISMHSSILDKNGSSICHTTRANNLDTINNKSTGIFLWELSPTPFWYGTNSLNFQPNICVEKPTNKVLGQDGMALWTDTIAYSVPTMTLTDGQNVTGDMIVLNNLVIKTNEGQGFNPAGEPSGVAPENKTAFDIAPVLLDFDQAIQQTFSIYAGNNQDDTSDNLEHEEKSFFKIEVDMGLNNIITGGQNNNKIKSVISRFYQVDSFTSSYGEGDITYQHKSNVPLNITDIGIRILKPDGEASTQIGNCNSVFLEIIRNK